jgi:protein phosphatase
MLEAYAVSDPGKVRAENQDAWRIVPELGLYLLADGMGGARGGERASSLAVDSVTDNLRKAGTRDAAALLHAVEEANERVLNEASRDPNLDGMGTTLVAALETHDRDIAIASVGDSRAYLLDQGSLRAITEDQTWIHDVGKALGLDDASLRTHPMRHVLTMAVGVSREIRVRYYALTLKAGDLLLLSSDGLHGVIDDSRIEEILKAPGEPLARLCQRLVDAAHEAGSPDNVTVLLMRPV